MMNELEMIKQIKEQKLVELNKELQLTKESIDNIEYLISMEKFIKEVKEELKTELLDLMKSNDIKKIETSKLSIAYVEPTTSLRLDSTALKNELPLIYKQYLKKSDVKEQVKITERKN